MRRPIITVLPSKPLLRNSEWYIAVITHKIICAQLRRGARKGTLREPCIFVPSHTPLSTPIVLRCSLEKNIAYRTPFPRNRTVLQRAVCCCCTTDPPCKIKDAALKEIMLTLFSHAVPCVAFEPSHSIFHRRTVLSFFWNHPFALIL